MLSIGILGFIVWSHQMMGHYIFYVVIIFSICWNSKFRNNTLYFSNSTMIENQQETEIESSETKRDIKFNFSNFYNHYKFIDPKFLEWLIGFSEGDGSFFYSGKRLYFSIGQKDVKVLYYIKETLGFGNVYVFPNKEYGRFEVSDKEGII
jgi:hypothetical protein